MKNEDTDTTIDGIVFDDDTLPLLQVTDEKWSSFSYRYVELARIYIKQSKLTKAEEILKKLLNDKKFLEVNTIICY